VKVLLDTHTFLWWVGDDSRLSPRARKILSDNANETFFSAASGWEIAIKTAIGRLKISADNPAAFVLEQVAVNGFEVLPIHLAHALKTYSLPNYHRDPFDRILIAQASLEGLGLLSADRRFNHYPVRVLW